MTRPTDPRRALIREYKGTPLSVLFALFAFGAPMSQLDLCEWTAYSSDNVASSLERLNRHGLVAPVPNGRHPLWQLTHHAHQLPFAFNHPHPSPLPQPAPALPARTEPVTLTTSLNSDTEKIGVNPDLTPRKSESPVVVVKFKDLKDLKDLKSFNNTNNTSDLTPKKSESTFLTLLTLGKVWQSIRPGLATRLAAGDIPLTLLDVAGIVCWAQDQAESIGAFVRYHVENGTQPPEEYVPPTDDLPRLLAWVRAAPHDRAALEESWQPAEDVPPSPIGTSPIGEGTGMGVMSTDNFQFLVARVPRDHAQHWHAIKSELQLQLTKSTFDTWLRDAELIDVLHPPDSNSPLLAGEGLGGEVENTTFTLLVETAYAKDWLEAKMISTLQRTAKGVTGQEVRFELLTPTLAQEKYPIERGHNENTR